MPGKNSRVALGVGHDKRSIVPTAMWQTALALLKPQTPLLRDGGRQLPSLKLHFPGSFAARWGHVTNSHQWCVSLIDCGHKAAEMPFPALSSLFQALHWMKKLQGTRDGRRDTRREEPEFLNLQRWGRRAVRWGLCLRLQSSIILPPMATIGLKK